MFKIGRYATQLSRFLRKLSSVSLILYLPQFLLNFRYSFVSVSTNFGLL